MPKKTSKDTPATRNEDVVELDPFLGNLLGVNYIPKCPELVSETETTKTVNNTSNNNNKNKKKKKKKEETTKNDPSKILRPAPQDVPSSSSPKISPTVQPPSSPSPPRPTLVSSSSSTVSSSTTTSKKQEVLSSTAASHDKSIKLMKKFFLNDDNNYDDEESQVWKQWNEERRSKRPGFKYYFSMSFLCVLWCAFILFFCSEVDDMEINPKSNLLYDNNNNNNNNTMITTPSTITVTMIQEHKNNHYQKNNNGDSDGLQQISQMLQSMSQIMVVGIHQDEKFYQTNPNNLNYSRILCTKLIRDKQHSKSPKHTNEEEEENMGIVTYNENKQLVEIKQLLGNEWKCTVSSSSTDMIFQYPPPASSSSFTAFLLHSPRRIYNVLNQWKDNLPIQKMLETSIINVVDSIPQKKSFQEDDILADAIFRVL